MSIVDVVKNVDFIDMITFYSDLTTVILQDIFDNKDLNFSKYIIDLDKDQIRFLKLFSLYQSLITCDKTEEIKIEGINAVTQNRDINLSLINLKADIREQTSNIAKMFKEKDENINIDIRNALAHGKIAIGMDLDKNEDFIVLLVNRSHWDSKRFQQTLEKSQSTFLDMMKIELYYYMKKTY